MQTIVSVILISGIVFFSVGYILGRQIGRMQGRREKLMEYGRSK